jgi:hypothetical protein
VGCARWVGRTLTLFVQQLTGQNRFSKRTPVRSTYVPKQYDNSQTLKLAQSIYERRLAEKRDKCISAVIDEITGAADEPGAMYDEADVNSSWITRLYYVRSRRGNAISSEGWMVMTTEDDNVYIFKAGYLTWINWRDSSSHGEFYNRHIRDNPKFTITGYCDL